MLATVAGQLDLHFLSKGSHFRIEPFGIFQRNENGHDLTSDLAVINAVNGVFEIKGLYLGVIADINLILLGGNGLLRETRDSHIPLSRISDAAGLKAAYCRHIELSRIILLDYVPKRNILTFRVCSANNIAR